MLPNPPPLMDESERKLYTLLALKELGRCTHLQLLYFMVENDIMSYFDLALALHDLVSEGQATKVAHSSDNLYSITAAGDEALSFFINRLAYSKVTMIREKAPAWRERFQLEAQFAGEISQNQNGEYVAHLRLMDGNTVLMSLDIPAPERKLANALVKAWPQHAADIYQFVLSALGEESTKT